MIAAIKLIGELCSHYSLEIEPCLSTILKCLIAKMLDIKETISSASNSTIIVLIEIFDPKLLFISLMHCIDGASIKAVIATLEIMNVVAKRPKSTYII